jgi:ubiquinone/menaquinone biosynthesis C-methylase UbiE
MRFRTKLAIGLLLIIAGVILSRPVIDYFVNKNTPAGNNQEDELSFERSRVMSPETIIKLLSPQPGSTVLDLGAGFGMYSFRLGQAVGSTGKVFATDVDPKVIAFLNERVREKGAANVIPVKVSGHGVDSFYREHKFDLIFASDVIPEIRSPEKFFDELRPSLKEGTGRLWIVNLRLDPDFTAVEFGDSGTLRNILLPSGVQSTIARRLSSATMQDLAAPPATATPDKVTAAVIADLNRMLEDPTLWPEAREKKWPLNQQDAILREVLTSMLDKKGVFTSQKGVTDETRRVLRLLNRLIIMDLMGSNSWSKAVALNKMSKSQLKPLLDPLTFPTFWGRPTFFDKIGYEVVQEHKTITYCNIWEFKRIR